MNTEALEKRAAYNKRLHLRGYRWGKDRRIIAPDSTEMSYADACNQLDAWEHSYPQLSYAEYLEAEAKSQEAEDLELERELNRAFLLYDESNKNKPPIIF